MNWPTSQDYNEAVQDPSISFSDPGLKGGEVVVNALGLPVPRSGNFADVYQFTDADGKQWALKCFTRKVAGLRERYAKIDEHLAKARLPFTVGFKFFEKGVRVRGDWFPLLKMEWVEGFTLNDFVARNLGKPHHLHALMQMWAKLAGRLRDANMAHADLQHGNVLLVPGATPQKLGLKLIDYDGMWVPALAEHHSGEVGHPNFQHPLRLKEKLYTGDVDRFPHLVIAAALRATLVGGQALWDRFDNGDNLLFKEADLRDPAGAPVFKALWELNDPVLRTLVGHIALSAKQPLRKTPWLDDVLFQEGGPKLSADEERRVCEMLGVTAAAPATARATAPAVEQEFNEFQFFDEPDAGPAPEAVRSPRRPAGKRKPAKKSMAPLFIAGGVGVTALLIGGIVVAMTLGGKNSPTTEVVQNKEKDKDDGPKPPIPPGPPNPPPPTPPLPPIAVAANAKEELRQALAGTRWDWGESVLELKADGSTYQRNWDEGFRLTTRWEPLDRRTALLVVEKGRDQDLYSVLELSDDLGEFTGFDFGSVQPMPARRRVGELAKPLPPLPPGDPKQDLRQRLAGSAWEWDGGPLKLNADGSAVFPHGPGRVAWAARWEPIDQRTAVVLIPQGKAHDRLAVLQFSDDLREVSGYDFENAARLPARKRLDAGASPPPSGNPRTPAVALAPLPDGRDYLFARQNDPVLYRMTQVGPSRRPREVGRHASPIRALAVAPDGSRAVTGAEDGEVRVWSLTEAATKPAAGPAKGDVETKTLLRSFKDIALFQGRFSIDAYEEGVVVHDGKNDQKATIPVGEPGHPVKGAFAGNLRVNPKLPDQLGSALTEEVTLFGGDLVVQVFEGGTQLWSRLVNKSWWGLNPKRKAGGGGPAGPGAAAHLALKEHTGPVLACAVSADGNRAVTLGKDRLLCEWDLVGAKLVRKFEVPEARAIAYLPGAKSVLLGTEGESAGVWDLEAKSRSKEVPGHAAPVRAVCVSPTGDLAWTGGEDGDVRAWSLPDFKAVGVLPGPKQPVAALAISPDAQVLATTGADGTVRFFEAKTGASFGTHAGKGPIHALAFLGDGRDLVVGRDTGPVVVKVQRPGSPAPPPPGAGVAVLKLVQEADGGDAPRRMGYRPDGKYFFLARPAMMTVADGATGQEVKSWPLDGNLAAVAFGSAKELYVSHMGGKFQAWDWEKGELLREFDAAEQRAPRVAEFWPAATPGRLVVTTNTPVVLLWDTAQWKEAERLTPYPMESITRAAPYPDGTKFAAVVAGRDGQRPVVWDVAARREALKLDPVDAKSLYRLEVSPGGRWIVGISHEGGGQAVVWDGKTGKLVHTVPGIRTGNFGGGFTPGGNHFVYCEYAGRRWDINLEDGRLAPETGGQKASFGAAAAPAAGLLASADTDRKVRVWKFDVDTKPADPLGPPDPKSPSPPVPVHKEGFLKESVALSDTIITSAVSGDGKKIYAVTQKGTVHVLDAATAEETGKYDVSKAKILNAVLSPKYLSPVSGIASPDRLYALDDERHLHIFEAEKGAAGKDVNLEKAGLPPVSAAVRLVIAPNESHLMVFDPDLREGYSWAPGRWSNTIIPAVLQRPPFNTATKSVAFSADGSVGAAYAQSKILVWRARAGKDIRIIEARAFPNWIGVSADAGAVAAADGGRLMAWKYETGGEVMSVRDPHGIVATYFAAAAPGGLVTVGSDRWMKVWDLRAGKEATKFRLEQAPRGVAVSPDGRLAVVWYEDGNKVGLFSLPDLKGKK